MQPIRGPGIEDLDAWERAQISLVTSEEVWKWRAGLLGDELDLFAEIACLALYAGLSGELAERYAYVQITRKGEILREHQAKGSPPGLGYDLGSRCIVHDSETIAQRYRSLWNEIDRQIYLRLRDRILRQLGFEKPSAAPQPVRLLAASWASERVMWDDLDNLNPEGDV